MHNEASITKCNNIINFILKMKILFNCNLQLCQKNYEMLLKTKLHQRRIEQGNQKMNHFSDFEETPLFSLATCKKQTFQGSNLHSLNKNSDYKLYEKVAEKNSTAIKRLNQIFYAKIYFNTLQNKKITFIMKQYGEAAHNQVFTELQKNAYFRIQTVARKQQQKVC